MMFLEGTIKFTVESIPIDAPGTMKGSRLVWQAECDLCGWHTRQDGNQRRVHILGERHYAGCHIFVPDAERGSDICTVCGLGPSFTVHQRRWWPTSPDPVLDGPPEPADSVRITTSDLRLLLERCYALLEGA